MEDRQDKWEWSDGKNVGFTVSSAKKWMAGLTMEDDSLVFKWSKWLPIKCNIFMWRASLDRLPTRVALARRGIQVANSLCAWCDCIEESLEHILTGCVISVGMWNGLSNWFRIPDTYAFQVQDLVNMHELCGASGNKKEIIYGLVILACWRLWKARNEKIFNGKKSHVVELISDVKAIGFLWYKHRLKGDIVDWDRWSNFDVM
ncbi:putative reverse transcriptase zinc-binding domain-containing protein [Helianthus debilis subsp. tardiflorus]